MDTRKRDLTRIVEVMYNDSLQQVLKRDRVGDSFSLQFCAMFEQSGIAWGDKQLQMKNWGEGNLLLSQERDLRWLVNMVAMFRCGCVYAEEAGKLGKAWRGRRSPRHASRITASFDLIRSAQ